MKITKSNFKRLFQEEYSKILNEGRGDTDIQVDMLTEIGEAVEFAVNNAEWSAVRDPEGAEEMMSRADDLVTKLVGMMQGVEPLKEELKSLGAHRTPDEAYQSLMQHLEGANKDLELLAVHLQGAKSTTEDVDSQLETLQQLTDYVTKVTWPDVKAITK